MHNLALFLDVQKPYAVKNKKFKKTKKIDVHVNVHISHMWFHFFLGNRHTWGWMEFLKDQNYLPFSMLIPTIKISGNSLFSENGINDTKVGMNITLKLHDRRERAITSNSADWSI